MKKQKRKHRLRRGKVKRQRTDGFRFFAHPFNGMDPEVVKAALVAVAEREIEEFPKLIERALDQLRRKYPPLLLSIVAAYSLQGSVTDEGVEKTLSTDVFQHHVELMQGLAMTLTMEEWGGEPAIFADVNSAMETMKAAADAYHHRRFKALEKETDAQARAVISLQERLRLHTQAVRNWGSYSQVIRISTELYLPLDDVIRAKLGFSGSDLVTTAKHMVSMLEARMNERTRWLSRVFREYEPRKIVKAYYKYHPLVVGDPEEMIKVIPAGATREHVCALLLQHADLLLTHTMTFTVDEVAAQTDLAINVTKRVLDSLGKVPGDFKSENPEHFFMGNPMWESPIIILDGSYFCPMPQAIFSHIHRIMHRISETAGALPELEARRPKYLEGKVAKLLAGAFPTGTVRNGTKWRLGGVEYETDHLLSIDKTVVIVEDKSHSLTQRGLRGAPERVREHVKDLISSPSEQSMRLEAMIWRAKAKDAEAVQSLAPFGVDFAEVERIIRINITLDDLTILSSAEDELKAAGWIRSNLVLAPTMTLADLETVIDILERPAFLLHYFAERQRVEKEGHVFADEIDFLGIYLQTGLNMGDLEKQNLEVALTGASAPIDRYYNSGDAGIYVSKPKPKLSHYFAKLVTAIEEKAFPRWTTTTMDVLRSAVFEEQLKIEKALVTLKANVDRNRKDPLKECCLVIRSHALKDTAIVFFAYPPSLFSKRKELAGEIAGQVLDGGDLKRCVVISRDTSRWDEPYSSILILDRPQDTPTDQG